MANRCINLSHPEFKELLSQSDLDPISLAADISLWQDRNNTDLFPGLEQLVPPVEKVEYRFAAVDKILAKLPILNKWWKDKSMSKDIFWKKFKELGIPAEQVALYQESTAESFEEVVVDTLAKYSFDVEIIQGAKLKDEDSYQQDLYESYRREDNFYDVQIPIELVKSDYYSNLTVPGGTNYQELEIKTPNITPSIKGHAEFATDQGIGWVRSDDAENTQDKDLPSYIEIGNVGGIIVSYSKENGVWKKYLDGKFYKNVSQEDVYTHYSANTPNKNTVRRVLELQSDLFQKGKTKEFLTEVEEYKKSKDFNKKENKFLQLLNKDGNWIKFFIQSIVADSKKKGYKNILFPAGETAAKIEGHETLENYKIKKEEELRTLEMETNLDSIEKVWSEEPVFNEDGKSITERVEVYKITFEGIVYSAHTKEELRRLTSNIDKRKEVLRTEIKAIEKQGLEKLKPIEGFYEVRVQNTLKKLYPDNVVRITDEYGNDWFSVNLYDERTGQVLFQKEFINEDGSRKRYIDEMVAIDKARKFNLANPNSKATVIKVMGEKGDRRVYYAIDVKSNKSTGQVLRDTIFQGESTLKSSELLSRIANSKHPLAKLAGKLLEYVKYNDVDVSIEDRDNTVTTKDGNSFSAAGAYYSDTNSITLFENAKYPESRLIGLILHEILHSLTYHQLRNSAKSSEEFAKLLEHARKFLPDQYALSNTDEFLVALFTDSKFISSLENVPAVEGKFKNFFQEVFDWFLKLLRLNKPEFYEQAFAVATNILEDFKVLNNLSPFPGEVLGEQEIKSNQDNKLKALLERTGFSLVTLSEYEKITGKKVNANALVDMAARLVAMADGASVKALTEELAHIAVAQSRETTEYKNAMKLLEATEEFEEFYDQYMEEYNDDTHVREEILGKILMKDLEVKLGTSIGMWLRRLWNKFLNKFRNNELSDYVSKITDKFIANPERSVNDSKIYFQLGEGEKTLQQQVNKLNRRYKELTRRQKSNPSLINQIRALREELEGNKNGVGIYKFLLLLNEDTKVSIDFVKQYFNITEKEDKVYLGSRTNKETPNDNMTKQLTQYIGYYLPFLKELNAILDEDSVISNDNKILLDQMIRHHSENFEVINRAYNQFLNENNRISTEAKELDIAGKRIMSTNELREAPRDSNFLETWFGLARNNSDVLVRLAHRAISDIKNSIRRAVLNWSDDFLANSMDYIGKDMSWVAERVTVDVVDKKTGLVTKKVQKSGNFIDEVHQGQWDIAREKFHSDLHDKYEFSQDFAERIMQKKVIQGYNPDTKDAFQRAEIQKLKEYNQEIAHWYKFNSVPNPRAKEIIAERKAALGYEQFEFWKLRNMELNPDGSVKYYKGELIVPSRGKERSEEFKGEVTYFKTKDWTNKNYDKLSDKDKTFLQYLKDQKKEIDKNIPFAVANRLPQMYESTLDIMKLNEPEVFKRLGKNIKSSIVRQEDDTEFNDTPTLNDGTILDDVPIRFTSLIGEPDRVTTDILSSLIAYKQMQENYVQMSAQLPMFENWLQGAKRRVVKSGDKVIRGEDSWSFDALKKFLQVHVSGKEKEDLTLTVLGTKVSVTKAVEKLSQWVRMKNLGFNFIAMTSNLISAKVFATLESIVGTYTTVKSSAFANKEFFSLLPTVMSSFNGVRSTDRISSLMTYFGLGRDIREMFDDLDKHVLMRNQPDRTLMYGFEKGDYFAKSIVMISILDNYRVHENKWYTAKEAKAAGLNFEEMTSAYNMLKTDKDGKVSHTIPDSVIDNITARMKTIATRVDGSLSPEDKGAIYQNAVFSMVGLHRGWLFEGLSRKLKTKGYDFTLNQITEGEYRTVMDLIGRFFMPGDKIQRIKNLLAKYNELEDYQKENLKRVMLELSMIAAFTIIALALNSGDDDDEEDYFRDLLAYQSNRVLLEVSSFYNPTELISAIKDPIVPARDLELVTNFTDMFNTEIIEKGKWEGMTKQQKYLLQLVPGIKGYTTLSDPDSQNNFLKNKNLKPTYSAYEFFFEEEK